MTNSILLKPIWLDFSDRIEFNSISYVMRKQYPPINHNLFFDEFTLPLIGCWFKLNYARTEQQIIREWTILRATRDCRNWGIFLKCTLVIKHTYGTYSCSYWVSKYKSTVHTILTKKLQFTGHKNNAIFEKINIISYHILCK